MIKATMAQWHCADECLTLGVSLEVVSKPVSFTGRKR